MVGCFGVVFKLFIKENKVKTIKFGDHEFELGKFHPCLVYNESLSVLSVRLRDCSFKEERVEMPFDVLIDNHPNKKQGTFVGFNMWDVRDMLNDQGYTRSSISLEHLIKRFDRYHMSVLDVDGVFGGYKDKILAIAHKHQFVWWIPK